MTSVHREALTIRSVLGMYGSELCWLEIRVIMSIDLVLVEAVGGSALPKINQSMLLRFARF